MITARKYSRRSRRDYLGRSSCACLWRGNWSRSCFAKHSVNVFLERGQIEIEVKEPTNLTHEEHSTILIEPGIYKVVQQREYTPEAIRDIKD